MFARVPNPLPARMKGLNRAEICDTNFIEFVTGLGQGPGKGPQDARRCCRGAHWTPAASANCSNHS